jgi:hypothetical protein
MSASAPDLCAHRPAPEPGARVCVTQGGMSQGVLIARAFIKPADAWGWSIVLADDGAVSLCRVSGAWPDLNNAMIVARSKEGPIAAFANLFVQCPIVADRAQGGIFDLAEVTASIARHWAAMERAKEDRRL